MGVGVFKLTKLTNIVIHVGLDPPPTQGVLSGRQNYPSRTPASINAGVIWIRACTPAAPAFPQTAHPPKNINLNKRTKNFVFVEHMLRSGG